MGNELEHHGVKGMHWGVRKAVSTAQELAKPASELNKLRPQKTQTVFNKRVKDAGGLHQVTDKELQAMLARLDMEQRYKKFVSAESERRAKGAKAALKILGTIGRIAIPIILGAAAGKAGVNAGIIKVPSIVLTQAIEN